jgi:hypothetical protein
VRRLENGTALAVNFPAFASHSPFKLQVGADDIADGFYTDFMVLQGEKNTWYAGSAILTHAYFLATNVMVDQCQPREVYKEDKK